MLFAAGFGTRMKHLTADRPKPLIPVADRPLVDHALELVTGAGVTRVVANLHYKPDALRKHLEDRGVQTVLETPDILETGGGLRNALPLLASDPVATMNTDAVWAGPNPLQMLIDAWDDARMDALLICVPNARVHGREGGSDFDIDTQGRLTRGTSAVYGGVQIMKTELLHDIEGQAFSLNLVWDKMAERDRLFGLTYPGHWCDVGHPGGIAEAEAMLRDAHV